jgi:hypothetical protein
MRLTDPVEVEFLRPDEELGEVMVLVTADVLHPGDRWTSADWRLASAEVDGAPAPGLTLTPEEEDRVTQEIDRRIDRRREDLEDEALEW